MSLRPVKRLIIVGSMLVFSIGTARAQTPSPEAMAAARDLVAKRYPQHLNALVEILEPLAEELAKEFV